MSDSYRMQQALRDKAMAEDMIKFADDVIERYRESKKIWKKFREYALKVIQEEECKPQDAATGGKGE